MAFETVNDTRIVMNKSKLNVYLGMKEWTYTELHKRISDKFGLSIGYKTLINYINNKNAEWKLIYAFAIADVLEIKIEDVFEVMENKEI